MITRRRIRKLRRQAEEAWCRGIADRVSNQPRGYGAPHPFVSNESSVAIAYQAAFDCEHAPERNVWLAPALPTQIWAEVFADWVAR